MAQKKSVPLNLSEAKIWLRAYLTQNRQAIGHKKQIEWSRRINQRLIKSPEFKKAKTIATYLGFGSEVLTDDLVEAAWRAGKNVLIPITVLGFKKPYFALLKPGDPLGKTRFGPLEPIGVKKPFDFKKIDLVIVPGLGFDSRGLRLGYGGGVYDRILVKTRKSRHIGLFFSCQKVARLPIESHDKSLFRIVTEKGEI